VYFAAQCLCIVIFASSAFSQTPLVNHGDTWRYHKGNTPLQLDWKTIADASLDETWLTGPGGFGYSSDSANETNQCLTILGDMRNAYTTVQMRRAFTIDTAVDPNLHLQLTMDFDDGFIAWLDGAYLASANVNGAPNEPAANAMARASRESSRGNSNNNPQPPAVYDLGAAGSRLGIGTHLLAIVGLNQSSGSSDFIQIADLALVEPGACPANRICSDTNWTAANSPYVISSTLTLAADATLTIEPGVTVLFNQGTGLTIDGRLIAEGNETNRIIFTRNDGATNWSQLNFTANSATSRLAHAEFHYFARSAIEAANTTLHLDSIVWTNSTAQAVDLHDSSITLLNSFIPGGAGNEPFHFMDMPPNGHALIKGCVFGAPQGYNDSIDFTGGNRPGPIAQFIDNVFLAAVDDCFDMDATDAHIEGNVFLNVAQDAQRDSSSSPITTGEGNGVSELVICRNIFYNCEHTLLLKDGGTAVMQNNTIIRLTTNAAALTASGNPIPPGIIMFGEPWRGSPQGGGVIYEGNIAYDLDPVIQSAPFPFYSPTDSFLVVSQSLTQGTNWPGAGNISSNPMFVNISGPMTAQNIKSNLMLMLGSPCIGTGPNGIDMGALVPSGASISGAPASPTKNTSATLRVAGPGVVAYRWKLNNGAWSSEIPLTNSLVITPDYFNATNGLVKLSNLAAGTTNTFYAIGKNSAGAWQETNAAASRSWVVESAPPLRVEFASRVGDTVTLSLLALAGETYSVFHRDALDAAHPWTKLIDVPAQVSTGSFPIVDTAATSATRYYQIVTPAQ
jgi:hypothetical protein